MITVTVNKKVYPVASLGQAHDLFMQKVAKRSSQMKTNDGLVQIDGTPTYCFSFNGRLWGITTLRPGQYGENSQEIDIATGKNL